MYTDLFKFIYSTWGFCHFPWFCLCMGCWHCCRLNMVSMRFRLRSTTCELFCVQSVVFGSWHFGLFCFGSVLGFRHLCVCLLLWEHRMSIHCVVVWVSVQFRVRPLCCVARSLCFPRPRAFMLCFVLCFAAHASFSHIGNKKVSITWIFLHIAPLN